MDFLSALMQHPAVSVGGPSRRASSRRNIPTASTVRPRTTTSSVRSPRSPPSPPPRTRIAHGGSRGNWGSGCAPPADWVATIDKRDHAITVSTDGLLVDGEPLDIALEYTPGDRMVFVEGEEDSGALTIRLATVPGGFRLTTPRRGARRARPARAHRTLQAASDREDSARSVEVPRQPDAGAARPASTSRSATRSRRGRCSRWSRR